MPQHSAKKRLNLANPYIFWSVIAILMLLIYFLNNYLQTPSAIVQKTAEPTIVEHSYKKSAQDKPIIVDVDNLNYMDYEKHQPPSKSNPSRNTAFLLLILYTVAISILFIYREKQNKMKLRLMEKYEDTIKVKLAEKEQKVYLYEHLKDDLQKHKDILEPELILDRIEQELTDDPSYIIIKSRVILEKTILKLYKFYFQGEATLNDMIFALHKKRILNPALNNYAHTIKAFGNKAVHPSPDLTQSFQTKDALLVLNTLLQYLQDLKSANLPEQKL